MSCSLFITTQRGFEKDGDVVTGFPLFALKLSLIGDLVLKLEAAQVKLLRVRYLDQVKPGFVLCKRSWLSCDFWSGFLG
ncbi:hypothetical protein Droror1_Dr00009607 [Drosera rotundifolia]